MAKLFIRHRVADFGKWKIVYDDNEATRIKYGAKKADVFTSTKNPNEIIVVTEWGSKEQAKKFVESSALSDAFKRAGLLGAPEVTYAE